MKKIVLIFISGFSISAFAQNPVDTNKVLNTTIPICPYAPVNNDTIVNLNSLNNGILKFQISKESQKIINDNGLSVRDGGVIVIINDTMIKKSFSFDVKTFASDNEWYENTIKVQYQYRFGVGLINVTSDKIEMATGFRKEGKIYVVIAVSMILFFTIIFYLIYLERKVKKLEKILKNKGSSKN